MKTWIRIVLVLAQAVALGYLVGTNASVALVLSVSLVAVVFWFAAGVLVARKRGRR